MKKTLVFLLSFLLLFVAFVACDSGDQSHCDTGSSETPTVVTDPVFTESTESTGSETAEPETFSGETVPEMSTPVETSPTETAPMETNPAETEPETEHTHIWGEWATVQEATCTKTGVSERVCSCGEKEIQSIDAFGHAEVVDKAVSPTCTETGLTEGKHCSACNKVLLTQNTIAALGHTPGVDATCTTNQACTKCGAELVSATGHSFGDWYTTQEPTETKQGEKRRSCENCDEFEIVSVAELTHQHNRWATDTLDAVAPTCIATGLTAGTKCSGCGEVLDAQEVIPATGHSMGNWKQTKAPTCTASGTEKRECSDCNHVETREMGALGHQLTHHEARTPTCVEFGWKAYDACTRCNYTTYEEITATGHTEFVDPAVESTCTESGLTEGKHCSVCSEVLVVQTIVAAHGHNYISFVTPPTATEDGYTTYICSGCDSSYTETLTPISFFVVPYNRSQIGYTGEDGENLVIPSVFQGDDGTWYRVARIGAAAFKDCTNIMSITIPGSVTFIDWWLCSGCINLSSVTIDEGVETIGYEWFKNCLSLTNIDMPNSIIQIDDGAFYGCCNLTSIIIPRSVTSIGNKAFMNCVRLSTITFEGTIAQWNAIATSSNWNLNVPATTVICSDGVVCFRHAEVIDAAVAPTCTTTGLTAGKTCSGCGEVLVVQEVIPANGHSMSEWKQTKAATCTASGTEKRECSNCDHSETRNVAATGHSHQALVTAPTCINKGYTTHVCHCGDSYIDTYLSAIGHSFGDWYETKAPTESIQGEKRRDCANCDHFETDVVAELTHDHSRWEQTTLPAVASTCTTTGLTEGKKCSECGETLVAQEIIPANGHDHKAVVTAPTCTAKGYTTYTCNCGDNYVSDEVVALGHSYNNGVITTEPTCTEKGVKTFTCGICGDTYTEEVDATGHTHNEVVTEPTCTTKGHTTYTCHCGDSYVSDEIAALGHIYGDDLICDVCSDEKKPTASGTYDYYLKWYFYEDDGLLVVSGSGKMNDESHYAFVPWSNYAKKVTKVIMDDNITNIGDYAFYGFTNLISISLPCQLKYIGDNAFNGCYSLIEIDIPESVYEIGSSAFINCSGLTTFMIPRGIKTIYGSTFAGCSNLMSIDIPDSVTTINNAFSRCSKLETITFNGTKEQWNKISKADSWNNNLNVSSVICADGTICLIHIELIVPAVAPTCCMTGLTEGVQCSICNEILIKQEVVNATGHTEGKWIVDKIPNIQTEGLKHQICSTCGETIKEEIIPVTCLAYEINSDGETCTITGLGTVTDSVININQYIDGYKVISIGEEAFYECTKITEVIIPSGVIEINDYAFSGCSSLVSVEIPSSVTFIGLQAFCDCRALSRITIPNSVLSIGSSAFSGCSALASVAIPNSVTKIGNAIFSGCSNLSSITVEDGNTEYYSDGNCVIQIENKTLIVGCKNSVIPTDGSVIAIGNSAFSGCTNLTSIEIPTSVTTIGKEAFRNCKKLTSIILPDSITSIGQSAFYGSGLISISIPDSVTSAGICAFQQCSSLTNVKIGNGVTDISDSMFMKCSSLSSVTIGNNVERIGQQAFNGCSSLRYITIPACVKKIGWNAFGSSGNLSGAYCYGNPTIAPSNGNLTNVISYVGNY